MRGKLVSRMQRLPLKQLQPMAPGKSNVVLRQQPVLMELKPLKSLAAWYKSPAAKKMKK